MKILALDIATRMGYAIGEAGKKPNSGAIRLRAPSEHADVAIFNVGKFIEDMRKADPFDLLVYEAPMRAGAAAAIGRHAKDQRNMRSGIAVEQAWSESGAVVYVCRKFLIRYETVPRITVLKHFTSRGWWDSPGEAKLKTLERCWLLGYLDRSCKDDDIADAIAVHDYASHTFARQPPRELVLFSR